MRVVRPVLSRRPLFQRLKLNLWQALLHEVRTYFKRLGLCLVVILIEGRDSRGHGRAIFFWHVITKCVHQQVAKFGWRAGVIFNLAPENLGQDFGNLRRLNALRSAYIHPRSLEIGALHSCDHTFADIIQTDPVSLQMCFMRIDITAFIDDERPRPVGKQVVHKQHRSKNGRGHARAKNGIYGDRVIAISKRITGALGNPARRIPDEAFAACFLYRSSHAAR